MVDTDTVQTLSIKGLSIPDDQRSAYSIEAPVTPPPSYMKVTASSKLKIVKILSGTLILLTLLVGSFVLGGLYMNRQRGECDCKKSDDGAFAPETRLAFLKEASPPVKSAGILGSSSVKKEIETNEIDQEQIREEKKNKRKNRKEERKQKRKQQREKLQPPPPSKHLQPPEPSVSIFRRLNLPGLLRQLEKATDQMAERIMEQNRRNRMACIMEKRREMMMNESPFGRRGPMMSDDDDEDGPRRHLILAPGGNGLVDCDEILGDFTPQGPPSPPFPPRAGRARSITLPIMAIVSRPKSPPPPPPPQRLVSDEEYIPTFSVPSPFNQPPPPNPRRNDFMPKRIFQSSEPERSPMERANFEGETVPNFQAPSPPIIYRHPLHADSSPSNSMMHPILSRLPRK